jgi:hypothetical protein
LSGIFDFENDKSSDESMHEEINEWSKKLVNIQESSKDSTEKGNQDSDSFECFTIFHQSFGVDKDLIREKVRSSWLGFTSDFSSYLLGWESGEGWGLL